MTMECVTRVTMLLNYHIIRLQGRHEVTKVSLYDARYYPCLCAASLLRTNTIAFSVQFITQGRLCLIVCSFSFCSLVTMPMASWQTSIYHQTASDSHFQT